MKLLALTVIASLLVSTAMAAQYKCFSSKYPTDMVHSFADGYTTLNVTKKSVNLKYYYVNTVARETTLELDVNYELGSINEGRGSLRGLRAGSLTGGSRDFSGDSINVIHFDESLVNGTVKPGVVGKFVFPGHGYSYDWNLCYNKN